LRNGRNCRSLLPSQSLTCVGCGRSDPIHPCLQPCCLRFQCARSPLALDPAGQAWLGWVLRELSRSFRDQRCSARRSADLTKRSSTKLPKSANTRWPATSAKCLIVRMASSSELWRIMATRQALECEGDHFDPVIKITNALRRNAKPADRPGPAAMKISGPARSPVFWRSSCFAPECCLPAVAWAAVHSSFELLVEPLATLL
jgi:hypothetical protein